MQWPLLSSRSARIGHLEEYLRKCLKLLIATIPDTHLAPGYLEVIVSIEGRRRRW